VFSSARRAPTRVTSRSRSACGIRQGRLTAYREAQVLLEELADAAIVGRPGR
jgi:hypothetical protein